MATGTKEEGRERREKEFKKKKKTETKLFQIGRISRFGSWL